VRRVTKRVQIRNMPEDWHRTLKARAARAGMSLSDYLLAELGNVVERPTFDELTERIRSRKPVRSRMSSAAIIRRWRDAG
jgi:plasmid stability protein